MVPALTELHNPGQAKEIVALCEVARSDRGSSWF